MPQHKVYALCEPGTLEVRYVGRTCQQLRHRLRKHISNSKISDVPSAVWIRSITATELEPDIRLLAVCSDLEIVGVERAWIAVFIDNGYDLLNVCDAGKHDNKQANEKQARRTARLTQGNIRMLGVPSEVHAQAVALAKRDGVKVYELVALALDLYDRINSPRNGSDQDGAQ